VLSFETNTFHILYEPLLREKYNGICNGNYDQCTMSLVNTHGIDYDVDKVVSTT
jgi:hypothetical protein